MPTVLLIDDNRQFAPRSKSCCRCRAARGGSPRPDEGLHLLAKSDVDLVIQDMNFRREATSGAEGVELFHRMRRRASRSAGRPAHRVDAPGDRRRAGQGWRRDYLAKPWDDTRLVTTVRNLLQLRSAILEKQALARSRRERREALEERFDLRGVVYDSDAMHELLAMATQVAPADVPVLITGPNGAGKEVLADIIQANSAVREDRSSRSTSAPFLAS